MRPLFSAASVVLTPWISFDARVSTGPAVRVKPAIVCAMWRLLRSSVTRARRLRGTLTWHSTGSPSASSCCEAAAICGCARSAASVNSRAAVASSIGAWATAVTGKARIRALSRGSVNRRCMRTSSASGGLD